MPVYKYYAFRLSYYSLKNKLAMSSNSNSTNKNVKAVNHDITKTFNTQPTSAIEARHH